MEVCSLDPECFKVDGFYQKQEMNAELKHRTGQLQAVNKVIIENEN